MISAVGFDLDNTLYDQSQHILSFFKGAAAWLCSETGIPAAQIYDAFEDVLIRRTPAHNRLFDETLSKLNIQNDRYVTGLVNRYHSHRTNIELYPGVRQTLEKLYKTRKLFLITNGHSGMQRLKVEQLAISKYFASMIFTGDYNECWSKPSTLPYEHTALEIGVNPADCVYVGDNPCCDFDGAHMAGMKTIRVLTGPYVKLSSVELCPPDYTICKLSELHKII